MINYLLIVLTIVLWSPAPISGARILGLFGVSSQSHLNVFTALTKELANRGHDLTVVTPKPIKISPDIKYRQIEVAFINDIFQKVNEMSKMSGCEKFNFVMNTMHNGCPLVLQSPEIKQLLNEKYDLILISAVLNDCCLPFAYHNKAPFIFMSPAALFAHTSLAMGNPEPLSYVPHLTLPYTDNMNFWQRLINFVFNIFLQALHSFLVQPNMNAAARKFFGNDIPTIEEIGTNASLALINNHVSINYPRPLNPNIIYVGGMQVKQTPEPLPKDIQEFLDSAKDGAIYFSLGSIFRGDQLPEEKIKHILQTFSNLKQRVLWKWESDTLPGQMKNVKFAKWLPQQSILAHPNVRLFITQGGLMSTQEALYHGVPLVGVPLFGDQELNLIKYINMNVAIKVDFTSLTNDTLLQAIQHVLQTPTFAENAKVIMQRIRDQPETPLERAVFWTEYVLRHDGAPHLRSAALHLAWYQLYLLDVAAFLFIAFSLVLFILTHVLRFICITRTGNVYTKDMKNKGE